MNILAAQTETISSKVNDAKKIDVSISYAPLLGFWLGIWPLGTNLSLTMRYFEWSTTLAIHPASDIEVSGTTLYTLVGPRYVTPSRSKFHFFVHGLVGAGVHSEIQKKAHGTFFPPFNDSHFGSYFSPGLGIYIKKPSKSGFRIGGDFVVASGFPSSWFSSHAYAIQLSMGIIF